MRFSGRPFVVAAGLSALVLPSCERKGSTSARAQHEEESSKGTALDPKPKNSKQIGGRPDKGRNLGRSGLTEDELVAKITRYDISKGYDNDYKDAVLDLIEKDPKLALATLFNGDTISQQPGFAELCEELISSDPDLLIAWLRNDLPGFTTDDQVKGRYWSDMLRVLAGRDPQRAIGLLQSSDLKETSKQGPTLGIFYSLSASNPDKALEMVAQLPESLRGKGYEGISYALAGRDPAKALEVAALVQNTNAQARLSSNIYGEWLKANPEEALKKLEQLDPRQFEKIAAAGISGGDQFIETLGEKKPEVLRDLLYKVVPGTGNKDLFEASVRALVKSDFGSALKAVGDLPAGRFRDELAELAFSVGTKPEEAAQYARMTEGLEGGTKRSALEGLGRSIANEPIEEIIGVSSNIDEANRSKFLLSAFTNSTPDRLDELAEKVTAQEFKGKLTDGDSKALTQDVAGRLVVADSDRAFSWYEQLPQDQRAAAMKGLASEMARGDIDRLGQWLNSKAKDDEWAIGASVMIKHLEYTDAQVAAEWKKALADSAGQRKK